MEKDKEKCPYCGSTNILSDTHGIECGDCHKEI